MALAWDRPRDSFFSNTATVLTIHNLAYQGIYPRRMFPALGLPGEVLAQLDFEGAVNLVITAVSPTFAREITTRDGGFGLDPILRKRSGDLIGIVNGIDPLVWNPAIDSKIAVSYDAGSIERRSGIAERCSKPAG